jgi:hypothetical protein
VSSLCGVRYEDTVDDVREPTLLRHFDAIWTGRSSRRAISVFSRPLAARSTIRARTTSRYGAA